jgi:hypothetical protein
MKPVSRNVRYECYKIDPQWVQLKSFFETPT